MVRKINAVVNHVLVSSDLGRMIFKARRLRQNKGEATELLASIFVHISYIQGTGEKVQIVRILETRKINEMKCCIALPPIRSHRGCEWLDL